MRRLAVDAAVESAPVAAAPPAAPVPVSEVPLVSLLLMPVGWISSIGSEGSDVRNLLATNGPAMSRTKIKSRKK